MCIKGDKRWGLPCRGILWVLEDNVGEGVEVVLRNIHHHTAISEGDAVQRDLPSQHWVDVDDVDDERLLVRVRVILSFVVHLKLWLIKDHLRVIRQGQLPLEVDVKGEGELVFIAQGMLHPVPVDVLSSANRWVCAPSRTKYLAGHFGGGVDARRKLCL